MLLRNTFRLLLRMREKKVVTKLQFIQEQTLYCIINVYKTTFIKKLQIEINILFINIYLEKLIQRLIVIINVQKFEKIINVTMLRIRNNLMSKKKQKLKLRIIFLQLKRR